MDIFNNQLNKTCQRLLLAAAVFGMFSSANALNVSGYDQVVVDSPASWGWVNTYDYSYVDMQAGAEALGTNAYHDAVIDFNGGSTYWLNLWGSSSSTISSGSVNELNLFGGSTASLNNVSELRKITIWSDSTIDLYGTNFVVGDDWISGNWSNGYAFTIDINNYTGNALAQSIRINDLNAVPLPASAWMFSTAIIGLGLVGRSRKVNALESEYRY